MTGGRIAVGLPVFFHLDHIVDRGDLTSPDGSAIRTARNNWLNGDSRTQSHSCEFPDRLLCRTRIQVGDQIDIGRHARMAVKHDSAAADHDAPYSIFIQGLKKLLEEAHCLGLSGGPSVPSYFHGTVKVARLEHREGATRVQCFCLAC